MGEIATNSKPYKMTEKTEGIELKNRDIALQMCSVLVKSIR